jgi:ribose transport system permease protein
MKKLVGVMAFLILVYAALMISHESARSALLHFNLAQRVGLYGILSIAAGMLIITGGIDLSVGSVVGFVSTVLCVLIADKQWSPGSALLVALGLGAAIGLVNGLLVTKLRLQAFLVTLCGLFVYRSAALVVAGGDAKGISGLHPEWETFFTGAWLGLPVTLWILFGLSAVAGVFLHLSVPGRYFYVIGSNEKAARFSGISVDAYKILAYVLCSTLTALFSFLSLMKVPSVTPSNTGSFDELYAIAGAVLGGCSLRGGEGTVFGFLMGAAIIIILKSMGVFWEISDRWDGILIGSILLLGTILDEVLRRRGAVRGT